MKMRALAAIGLGAGCLLVAADEPKQVAQVSNTQHLGFPAGGTLRLKNSIGVLTVEAWDRTDMELTTVKSSKVELDARAREKAVAKLEKVRVTAETHGNEFVVTTDYPRFGGAPPNPLAGEVNFRLEYHIKVPANARLIDEHGVGEVNVDGLTGDIDVTLLQGEIMLHLPEEGRYSITAKSDFGSVNSDFPGEEKRRPWLLGHRLAGGDAPAPHKLNLKVGWGDIVLLKTRIPKAPESLIAARKPEGL